MSTGSKIAAAVMALVLIAPTAVLAICGQQAGPTTGMPPTCPMHRSTGPMAAGAPPQEAPCCHRVPTAPPPVATRPVTSGTVALSIPHAGLITPQFAPQNQTLMPRTTAWSEPSPALLCSFLI